MYEIPRFFLQLSDKKLTEKEQLSLSVEAMFLEKLLETLYPLSDSVSSQTLDLFQKTHHQLRVRDFSHKTEFTHLRGIPNWKDWTIKTRHMFKGDARIPYVTSAIQIDKPKLLSMNIMVDGKIQSNPQLRRYLLLTSDKPLSSQERAKNAVSNSGLNPVEDATPYQVSINGKGFDLKGYKNNAGKFHLLTQNKIEQPHSETAETQELWVYVCEWLTLK